jgi:2-dehydropantoate 2-reductase
LVKSSWQPDRKGTLLMKIALMGAGAVGCYYGFKLARAEHEVVLIGRPQHVEAIQRHGLRLETQAVDNAFASLPAPKPARCRAHSLCSFA